MLSSGQMKVLRTVITVLSSVSLFSASLVILTYALFKSRRQQIGGLLTLTFSVSAFFLHLVLLMGAFFGYDRVFETESLCLLQAGGIQFFGSFTMLLWGSITLNLFLITQNLWNAQRTLAANFVLFIGIPLLGAVLMTLLPGAGGAFGDHDGFYCWMATGETAWMFGSFYAVMATLVCVGSALWLQVLRFVLHVKSESVCLVRPSDRKPAVGSYWRKITFLFAMIVLFVVMFANEVLLTLHPRQPIYGLWMVHLSGLSLIGFWVLISCGCSSSNIMLWRRLLCSVREKRRGYSDVSSTDDCAKSHGSCAYDDY